MLSTGSLGCEFMMPPSSFAGSFDKAGKQWAAYPEQREQEALEGVS
jgi:hypothetical protein